MNHEKLKTMKILATGDWHIGKMSHGFGRADEHRHFLNWLKEQAKENQADILLVTGDVFDTKDPTPLSQEIYYDFLDEVSQACPGLRIVIIAGNHDNPTLLEAPQGILKRHNVTVRGFASGCEDDDQSESHLIIPVDNERGDKVWIIAIPYLRRSDFKWDQSYEKSVAQYLSSLVRATNEKKKDGEPIVMMAHLYATGSLSGNDEDRSETIYVGGEPEIKLSTLTNKPDFLLSGHIHKRMKINGFSWAQYTGSALPMSFSETGYKHGADLIIFESGKEMTNEFLEYTPMSEFISFGPDSPDVIIQRISELKPRMHNHMFIRAKVGLDTVNTDLEKRIKDLAGNSGAHIIYDPEIKVGENDESDYSSISKPEDLSSDKIVQEVIMRRFASRNGRIVQDGEELMNDEEKKLLEEIITKARGRNEE